jgi:hypothetical protein
MENTVTTVRIKPVKEGAKVRCSLFGNQIATVRYYNPASGEIELKYPASKYVTSTNITNCIIL